MGRMGKMVWTVWMDAMGKITTTTMTIVRVVTSDNIKAAIIIVLGILVGGLIWQYAGSLGRISVLMDQVSVLEDSIPKLHALVLATVSSTDSTIQSARANVDVAVQELAAAVESARTQEVEAESAFRRAVALADNPEIERAIEEMRAESIVTSMEHEEAERVSASALLRVQVELGAVQGVLAVEREARAEENRVRDLNASLKDQIIEEQQRALVPSFFPNLFKNAKLVVGAAVVGGAITYLIVNEN